MVVRFFLPAKATKREGPVRKVRVTETNAGQDIIIVSNVYVFVIQNVGAHSAIESRNIRLLIVLLAREQQEFV